MKDILNKIIAGLDTHTVGFSARKMSAFVIITCCIAAHVKWIALGDFKELDMVLTIDYGFIALCLGMTTYENIKKNGNTSPTQP
jgi:hypothetical protein